MDPIIALVAALIGYLLGSISFARIVAKLVAPDQEIKGIEFGAPGTDQKMESDAIGGTAVSAKLGAKWGLVTALFDILKAALPALAFRLIYPDTYYFLIAAVMTVVGHNWPLYYRFKGGRGMSPIYGGLLVLDWIGSLVTSFVGMFLGMFVLKQVLLAYMLGLWLMIPWIWFWTRDLAYLAYVIAVNVLFVVAMIPDMIKMIEFQRKGVLDDQYAAAMESTPMLRGMKKIGETLSFRKKKARPEQ